MKKKFLKGISETRLLDENTVNYLAISGGADSVALAMLLRECNIPFEMLHVNYKLRGTESDQDEHFLKKLAKKWNIPLHVLDAGKEMRKSKKGESIQMIARDIRYRWFNRFVKSENTRILTAHNKNDRAENFLLHLVRGSRGNSDIPLKNGAIVRPLLHFSKSEIIQYLKTKNQNFRNDSSNEKEVYSRNFIRLRILPLMEKMNPSILETIIQAINKEKQWQTISHFALAFFEKTHVKIKDNVRVVSIREFYSNQETIATFQLWLEKKGFETDAISKILSSKSGAVFTNKKFELIKDRDKILLRNISEKKIFDNEFIFPVEGEIKKPIQIKSKIKDAKELQIKHDKFHLYLDADDVKGNFTLRKAKKADRFEPFGFRGSKKISDFYTQEKMNRIQKEEQWLLCYDHKILWVIGKRASKHFPITTKTKRVLILKVKNE
jgi:tRNA(Ile)-lysidine synthase